MEPRLIANSGGRTSGVMTWLECQKGLAPTDYVVFVNTGLEDNRTLDFLHAQAQHWGINIIWLEYCPYNQWKQVSYETASRVDWYSTDVEYLRAAIEASPFWRWIMKKYLTPGRPRRRTTEATLQLFAESEGTRQVLMVPNGASKFCTQEMKVRVMKHYMISQGHQHWQALQGIRADEPHRAANARASKETRYVSVFPLYQAGIVEGNVFDFWGRQPFDLALESHQGNCRFCFEKRQDKLLVLMKETPVSAGVLAEMEQCTRTTFIQNRPYAAMIGRAGRKSMKALREAMEAGGKQQLTCFCGE